MLKYYLTAIALKAFSINSTTKKGYRRIGNFLGNRWRTREVKANQVERADGNLRFLEDHGAIADGYRALELGTGWVHWESLFTRLFYDIEITLFDVGDNRQLDGLLHYVAALRDQLPAATQRSPEALARADRLCGRILACSSFDEVYRLLGFRYVVDPEGRLDAIADNSLDVVFSSDVMEHVPAATLPRLAADLRRAVKDGGHISQQIVEADHLTIYARSVHRKNYLRYTDRQWRFWFENEVQYINRWQHSDFVTLYRDAGFEIIDEQIVERADTQALDLAPQWRNYDRDDLDAAVTRLLVRNRKD